MFIDSRVWEEKEKIPEVWKDSQVSSQRNYQENFRNLPTNFPSLAS
jgi:hypothetical protein